MKGKLIFKTGQPPRLVFSDVAKRTAEVDATDAARALAQEEKGDGAEAFLTSIEGTGKDGRVTVSDVRAALDRG